MVKLRNKPFTDTLRSALLRVMPNTSWSERPVSLTLANFTELTGIDLASCRPRLGSVS
jgi:hypothetical protein